jgi:hypothetical protein
MAALEGPGRQCVQDRHVFGVGDLNQAVPADNDLSVVTCGRGTGQPREVWRASREVWRAWEVWQARDVSRVAWEAWRAAWEA